MPFQINLVPGINFEKLAFRKKLFLWATTTGKVIIVVTELFVLLTFVYRFYLDKNIKEIAEAVDKKANFIENNLQFVDEYNKIQDKVYLITQIKKDLYNHFTPINKIQSIAPVGISILRFDSQKNYLILYAETKGTLQFSSFLETLMNSSEVKRIHLTSADFVKEENLFKFSLELNY